MTQFNNVTLIKHANIYFDGKVTSRTIIFPDGERKTVGIMMPGEYTFNTDAQEIMEILVGKMDVLLPGNPQWLTISAEQSFTVPANSSFQLRVSELVDYCCSYVK